MTAALKYNNYHPRKVNVYRITLRWSGRRSRDPGVRTPPPKPGQSDPWDSRKSGGYVNGYAKNSLCALHKSKIYIFLLGTYSQTPTGDVFLDPAWGLASPNTPGHFQPQKKPATPLKSLKVSAHQQPMMPWQNTLYFTSIMRWKSAISKHDNLHCVAQQRPPPRRNWANRRTVAEYFGLQLQ